MDISLLKRLVRILDVFLLECYDAVCKYMM